MVKCPGQADGKFMSESDASEEIVTVPIREKTP
jgi:hypothetical protein